MVIRTLLFHLDDDNQESNGGYTNIVSMVVTEPQGEASFILADG